jgi:hypothetical protein
LLVIVPAVAVKVAVVLAVPTVTVAGIVSATKLLDSVTVARPVCDTVNVHVEFPPVDRLVGAHVTPLTTVATKEIDAVSVLPFSVAVIVAVWLLVIAPAVAVKVAVVLPDATVTVSGTVNAVTLLDSVTVAPPVCDTVNVHVEVPPDPSDVGTHVTPLTTVAATTVPVPESVMLCGDPVALSVMVMDALRLPVAVGVNVTEKLQLSPAGTLLPQVLVCAKSPGLVPVLAMVLIPSAAVPVLLSVTDWAGLLVVPTLWFAKVRLLAVSEATGDPFPVPDSAIWNSAMGSSHL